MTLCFGDLYLRSWSVYFISVEDSIEDDTERSVGIPVQDHQGQVVVPHQALGHQVGVWY